VVSDPFALQQRYAEMQAAEAEVEKLYARWAELELRKQKSGDRSQKTALPPTVPD
jgi:hypothetical protein